MLVSTGFDFLTKSIILVVSVFPDSDSVQNIVAAHKMVIFSDIPLTTFFGLPLFCLAALLFYSHSPPALLCFKRPVYEALLQIFKLMLLRTAWQTSLIPP